MNTNKMYILIRDDVDLGHALLAAAHAALSGYLTFVDFEHSPEYRMFFGAAKDPSDTELWASESFRKVICRVTHAEFEKAKTLGTNMKDYRIMTESGLNNMEVAIVFRPKDELPKFIKFLKLYREMKNVKGTEGSGQAVCGSNPDNQAGQEGSQSPASGVQGLPDGGEEGRREG